MVEQTQFSVFLVNKPGILAQITTALAKGKVNIIALTLMDSMEHGVLRIVCEQPDEARKVLGKAHDRWTETDVLVMELENRPGSFAKVAEHLADNHINMIKLESRPIQGRPWKYMFYMDLEVDLAAEKMSPIREVLEEKTDYLKILGSYCSSLTKEMPPRDGSEKGEV